MSWRIVAMVVISSVVAAGQGGANYTVFGFGHERSTFGAAYEGLAGAAHAVPSDYVFGIANPALWSLVRTTRIQGGYRFNQQYIEQGGSTRSQNNGKLDGAALLFAIDTTREIAASIGMFPSSSVNYTSQRRFSVELPEVGTIDGSTTYSGSGGMVTAYTGIATRVVRGIYLGAAALYGFGVISDAAETTLATDAGQRANSVQTDRLATLGARGGIYAELGGGFSAGIAAAAFQPLRVERTLRYQSTNISSGQTTFDTSFTSALRSPMPLRIGGGITYAVKRWLVTLDGEWAQASRLQYRYSPLARPGDSYRLSLAGCYRGSRAFGVAFEDRISIGAGVALEQLPVTIDGQPLRQYSASLGLQIPFGGAAMIDAALIGGIRGNGLPVREEFFRLSITLSVGEVWFVPFRR